MKLLFLLGTGFLAGSLVVTLGGLALMAFEDREWGPLGALILVMLAVVSFTAGGIALCSSR